MYCTILYNNFNVRWARAFSSAGCHEHTFTKSVYRCAQFAKGVLMLHFVHTFWGVYTLNAHFWVKLKNFLRTFLGLLGT